METTLYKIDGRNYKMFTLNILGKPMQVASYALNRKIAKMIEEGRITKSLTLTSNTAIISQKKWTKLTKGKW